MTDNIISHPKRRIAAIGTFDGVHRGHRVVLDMIRNYARDHDMEALAVTFTGHPLEIIDKKRAPRILTPLNKKIKLLEEAGVTPLLIEFDDSLRKTSAREWLHKLHEEYGVDILVMGYDNTFGCDGVNLSLDDYSRLGEIEGIKVLVGGALKGVSSSAIRKAVGEGDMEKARTMLGRPYSITAKVGKGNQLGRSLGYPTANIGEPDGVAIPKPGVYAAIVKTLYDGKKHAAMVNVGTRPTVMRGDDLVVEAHLIDWEGDLYDRDITVRFLKRIRDEKKFDSIDALKQQLSRDKEICAKIVENDENY